jgi:Ca2+-binding RTX toxin-like protein
VLGTASLTAGGVLSLAAGDNVTVQSGATVAGLSLFVQGGAQNAEPNTGAIVTFLGNLSTPGARLLLSGSDAGDVFVVGPQVAADAVAGTTVEVLAGGGTDQVNILRADVPTTVDTGAGTDTVAIRADGGQSNVTSPVINAPLTITSPDADQVVYNAAGFTVNTQGRLTATDLTGVGMGPNGRVVFGPTSQLLLLLGSGSDDLTIDGTPTGAAVTVSAGDGDDRVFAAGTTSGLTLKGEAGNDLLVGGSGQDVLDGGAGNDVLIGRGESDSLLGGDGEDLLIAGTTAFDLDRTALLAVVAEWTRRDADVATRVAHLRGQQAGGLNGPSTLTAATVSNDTAVNTLTGDSKIDWFFCALGSDQLTDLAVREFTN